MVLSRTLLTSVVHTTYSQLVLKLIEGVHVEEISCVDRMEHGTDIIGWKEPMN